MCSVFHRTALEISGKLGIPYDAAEAKNSRSFLEHVQRLPRDAKEIY